MKRTTIRNQNLFCLNCGGEWVINYPIGLRQMTEQAKAFDKLHENCLPTWQEPNVEENKSIEEKAMWWIENGERGMSSETMWNCLIGNRNFQVSHPYDPDDFKRCYKLLKAIPEWRNKLNKLKRLSNAWSNLVDNWDKLTEMYEENVRTNWKNYEQIGMYEFMQTLIK